MTCVADVYRMGAAKEPTVTSVPARVVFTIPAPFKENETPVVGPRFVPLIVNNSPGAIGPCRFVAELVILAIVKVGPVAAFTTSETLIGCGEFDAPAAVTVMTPW